MKKNIALILAAALVLPAAIAAGGCGANSGVSNSAEATAENPMVLTLAHGLSETHTVHIAMTQFADEVKEKTDERELRAAAGRRNRNDQGFRTGTCHL